MENEEHLTIMANAGKCNGTRSVKSASQYKERDYWENRFKTEEGYEWLCKYKDIKDYICRDVNVHDRILILGCGNSRFSADLHNSGFKYVTSVDFSSVVIDAMRKKYVASHPSLQWIVADVRDMKEIEDDTFDVVIDKACLDALVCDEGDPWSPNEQTKKDVEATVCSVVRVLKRQGNATFISIGFQQPHFRKRYLLSDSGKYGWEKNVETFTINIGIGYFYTRCKLHLNDMTD